MAHGDFYSVLTDAINDVLKHGFDSEARVEDWQSRLKRAAESSYKTTAQIEEMLRGAFGAVYRRMVMRYGALKYHPGISRFTVDRLAPRLRAELDRRVLMAAGLIKLNKQEATARTLRRFSGWASSIPKGGSDAVNKLDVKLSIKKSLAGLPFEERRVATDQGHKFTAAINEIIAIDNGAIAVMWHSHWRQANYNYREDHKERDGKVYLLRDSWAKQKGFVKPNEDGYYEDIDGVGQAVYCRCYATFVYALSAMPADMLTTKGKDELQRVRMLMEKK